MKARCRDAHIALRRLLNAMDRIAYLCTRTGKEEFENEQDYYKAYDEASAELAQAKALAKYHLDHLI